VIVAIDSNVQLVLRDEYNFRALKVQIRTPLAAHEITSAFGALGLVDGDHVWLSIGGLRAMGPNEQAWHESYDAMIAFATRSGWVSENTSRVRAHIESVGG
jgi:hypothetical protein